MNILCITDRKWRVQYNRMVLLKDRMVGHNIDIKTLSDKKRIDFGQYDTVYYSHFSIAQRIPCNKPIRKIASVTSHKCLSKLGKTIKELRAFDSISVNNTFLLKALKPHISNIHYTPNGVDTSVFTYKDRDISNPIKIGWVGNKDRAAKRYKKILIPLRNTANFCDFRIVGSSKKDTRERLLNQSQMRDFYHSLDFFVVTSDSEGTPNPSLEAMACGVPVISSEVGNMVEIITDGYTGFLVDGSIESYYFILKKLSEMNNSDYQQMRQRLKKVISQWSWDVKFESWKNFLEGQNV